MQCSASSTRLQPPTSTAPVLDFVCLFTHDLRRKQKRWQDGRLKYHTFNNRVMVYDERGNFIGDTHWRDDYDLGEGEELQLERGGVIVQVSECTGSREQDLSELIDKRAQEKAQRQSAAAARRHPTAQPATPNHMQAVPPARHRPLHNVIGTPTGHHGRALVSNQSPYEERQRQKQAASPQNDSARPAKRRKRDISPPSKSGYAQSLFGATLSLSGYSASQASLHQRLSKPPRMAQGPPRSSATAIEDEEPENSSAMVRSRDSDVQKRRGLPGNPGTTQSPSMRPIDSVEVVVLSDTEMTPSPPRNQPKSSRKNTARSSPARSLVLESISTNQKMRELEQVDPASKQIGAKRHSQPTTSRARPPDSRTEKTRPATKARKPDRSQRPTEEPAGPKASETIGLTREPPDLSADQVPAEQPRTELRIKRRKKKGLLMVAEQANDSVSSLASGTTQGRDGRQTSVVSEEPDSDRAYRRGLRRVTSLDTLSGNSDRQYWRNGEDHRGSHENIRSSIADDVLVSLDASKSAREQNTEQQGRTQEQHEGVAIAAVSRRACQHTSEGRPSNVARHKPTSAEGSANMPERDLVEESAPCNTDTINRSTESQATSSRCLQSPEGPQGGNETSPRRRKQPTRKKRIPPERAATTSRAAKVSERIPKEDYAFPDGAPAPRLARLSRKSVRSKEVIGFIIDDEEPEPSIGQRRLPPVIETPHTHDFERLEIAPVRGSPEPAVAGKGSGPSMGFTELRQGVDMLQAKAASVPQNPSNRETNLPYLDAGEKAREATAAAEEAAAQMASKLPNPATRGKKAARPSDAAGKMPACPLPPEATSHMEKQKRPAQTEVQGNQGTTAQMPGFSRANGGPWSREAHDLFDFQRPSS
ncbi:hypothetical protein GGR56DRAFT_471536 [Xylariaceae sp. FL0804]|nr:hypothetical protein GGR56DRAFT_471536 [Xylariaceae sp. FL0804]